MAVIALESVYRFLFDMLRGPKLLLLRLQNDSLLINIIKRNSLSMSLKSNRNREINYDVTKKNKQSQKYWSASIMNKKKQLLAKTFCAFYALRLRGSNWLSINLMKRNNLSAKLMKPMTHEWQEEVECIFEVFCEQQVVSL